MFLKEELLRKVKEDEIKWKQRPHCEWLKEGDKIPSSFMRWFLLDREENIINALVDCDARLEICKDIFKKIIEYFTSIHTKEEWNKPLLDNLDFSCIGGDKVAWLERDVEEV